MQTRAPSRWWLRLVTLVLAAAAAASAGYWVLKARSGMQSGPAPAPSLVPVVPPNAQAISRLMGASAASSAAVGPIVANAGSERLKLMGVVAGKAPRGVALISVDGKPARPFNIGSQVTDTLVLTSVAVRSAALGPDLKSPVTVNLELPKPPQP